MAKRMRKSKFNVISPDGIPIQPNPFHSKVAAEAGAKAWAERFNAQGFYSSASLGRIPIEDLAKLLVIEPCETE